MQNLNVYHNSWEPDYRSPFGAVQCGNEVKLSLKVFDAHSHNVICRLKIWRSDKGEQIFDMDKMVLENGYVFSINYTAPSSPCVVWYSFVINLNGIIYYYGNNKDNLGGQGQLYNELPPSFQISVYNESKVPDWYKEGIMYQIYVDRFNRGDDWLYRINSKPPLKAGPKRILHLDWDDKPFYNKNESGAISRWSFFGGTINGIRDKLSYLKELGVTVIYLNPIFEGASNHKYDTANYKKIDSSYGDDDVFDAFISEAKEQGINVILDGVFSHTGCDSIYFNKYGNFDSLGAYQSKESRYYKWYKFYEYPDKYESWWGIGDLPNVNEMEPSYVDYICRDKDSVIRRWINAGIKGWRLDVADELPDEFIKEIKKTIKDTDSDAVLLGEVWEDASHKEAYGQLRQYLFGDELDSTMNYPFRNAFINFFLESITAFDVHRIIMSLYENYPRENFYAAMNLIGTHDRARILTVLSGAYYNDDKMSDIQRENYNMTSAERSIATIRLKLISAVQMCFPGIPCIYYGDEAGVEGFSDPFNRATFPWGREDTELINWYKKITGFRRELEVLKKGDFSSFAINNDIYGIRRRYLKEELIMIVNRSTATYNINIPISEEYTDLIENKKYSNNIDNIKPLSVMILLK